MRPIICNFYIVFLFGCSPKFYVPNSQNVPLMKIKAQTNLGISFNESAYTSGFEIQAAHAITDKIALQFNGDWVKNGDPGFWGLASEEIKVQGKMLEIGPGYYKAFDSNFIFETYGLLGFGSIDLRSNTFASDDFSAKLVRAAIQPSISYSRKHFSTSLSSRIVNLKFSNISGGKYPSDYDPNYLKENNSNWLLEPALTIQVGFEKLKLQLQYVYSHNITNPSFEQETEILSLGLKFNINPTKKIRKRFYANTSFNTSSDFGFLKPTRCKL